MRLFGIVKKSFLFSALLINYFSWSSSKLLADDLWILVDEKVSKQNLCDSFVDGAFYLFERESCSRIGCDQWNYEVHTFCDNIKNLATIEHWKKGKIYRREYIDSQKWFAMKGNLLRFKQAYVNSFGNEFQLERVQTQQDGHLRIDYVIRRHNKTTALGYWLIGDGPAIPQILLQYNKTFNPIVEENTDLLVR